MNRWSSRMEQVSARSCLCAPCHPPAQPESVVCSVSMLADLDTTTHASGFAEDEAGHWNLGRLAAAPGSVLDDTVQVAGGFVTLAVRWRAFCSVLLAHRGPMDVLVQPSSRGRAKDLVLRPCESCLTL